MLPTASSKRRTFAAKYFTRSKSLVMGEQNRSPGRPLGPHKLGPVLKAGWLKKQRSIMKNWQQRWFVLRGDQLFYYKDKDESKPQARRTSN
uniref:rho GTPase-activating protein 22 isoform X8 n=1 Tax=Myodes glareolus TaxID=447135 RepID=UPI0020200350|nr:rho GTPase-activating protein 22 isoform X8 [Myodes glareolus]